MAGYPQNPSGYPQNPSGYGQPYTPSPYGPPAPGPQQPYGAQPQSAQSPYAPVAAPYGAPSAPYAAPQGNKPPKEHNKPTSTAPYGAPTPAASYGSPTPAAPYGSPTPAAPYGAPQQPHSGGYPPSAGAPYGSSPFASLVPSAFPPGTDPNVASCFQMADRDRSGFIDDKELQSALSGYNQGFSLRTVHLLMYLFTNTNTRQIGPKEFTAVFYSLQSWRSNFEKFDRDRSGKIDSSELRDALASLGFSVSPVVLDLLVSKFDKSGGHNKAIEYDNFIECCLTVKGLTEKFKEKDTAYSGNATFTYESFMLTVLPFLIA